MTDVLPAHRPPERAGTLAGASGRARLRRRLQPRAVARGGLGGGRRADARGRRQPGQRRHLLLGPARAGRGRVRLRLAGPAARPAARRRHRRRPRHPHRRAAAVVLPRPTPRPCPVTRRTACAGPAGARHGLPQLTGLPRAAAGITEQLAGRYGDHPAVALWHVHNEYGAPVSDCYCDDSRRGLPPLAARPLRHPGRAQRRLGHRLLGPALRRLGRDRRPALARHASATRRSSWTSSASPPTHCSSYFIAERDVLRRLAPGIPVTTNFMATNCQCAWTTGRWAARSTSSPTTTTCVAERADNHVDLAMGADLTRSPRRRPARGC